jgi:hypothetical protein
MKLLSVEALMASPWPTAARRVLPASSPEVAGTALWGPVMSWCLLQMVAEAVDGDNIQRTAGDLFDRFRLREPLAQAFQGMGLEGEEGWRAAARVKLLLLMESGAGRETPSAKEKSDSKLAAAAEALASEAFSAASPATSQPIPPSMWQDPDVRWLTGFNEADGHSYVNREQYEQLLWWLALPELLKLANMAAPTRAAAADIKRSIDGAMAAMKKAGYRVDLLLKGERPAPADQPDAMAMKITAMGSKPGQNAPMPSPEELEPEEPVNTRPAGPGIDPEGPPEDH